MEIQHAQTELRSSFVAGGPGTIVSGCVWLAAGFVAANSGISTGFPVLFFGGMLIFPISLLIVRTVFSRPAPSRENLGGQTVVETVFPMIGGLFAAWLLMPHRPDFVFPVSAIAVGAHYFGFRTAYGMLVYRILGGLMCLIGTAAIVAAIPGPTAVPFVVAVVEIAFGAWITYREQPPSTT